MIELVLMLGVAAAQEVKPELMTLTQSQLMAETIDAQIETRTPSPWEDWLGQAYTMFGDPRPAGERPLSEIIVITDQQVKYLGGERTALQSLTSDAAVDVSVRPIALDLFGFSAQRVMRLALTQYRAVHPDRHVVYVDTGDLVDLGCRKELPLVFHEPVGSLAAKPDLVAPGNHDFNYAGTFRKGTDLFGFGQWGAGGSVKQELWAPNCAVVQDAPEAAPTFDFGTRPGSESRLADERSVILEKDAYAAWWAAAFGGGLDVHELTVPVARASKRSVTVGEETLSWDDIDAVADRFWYQPDNDTWLTSVRLDQTCKGPPGPFCREAGRGHLVLSATRLMPGTEYWIIGMDNTDQLRNNIQVPGMYASFSVIQARLIQAFMAQRREAATQDRPARFVVASHFPLEDLVYPNNLVRSHMDAVLGQSDVMFAVAGHSHFPDIRKVDWSVSPGLARRRAVQLQQYIAGSVLDFPVSGMRVSLVQQSQGHAPMLRPVVFHFELPTPDMAPSELVDVALRRHRAGLVSYRTSGSGVRRWQWEKALSLGRYGAAFQRLLFDRWRIERDDAHLLMDHQFEEMVALLQTVSELLIAETLGGRNDLRGQAERLESLSRAAAERFAEYTSTSLTCADDVNWRKVSPKLGLFEWTCIEALGVAPSNPYFGPSTNCTEAIQYAVREIPEDTWAFEFMFRVSQQAAVDEFCTGPYTELWPSEACESEWHMGPGVPKWGTGRGELHK